MTNPFAGCVEMPEVVGESRYQDMLWLIVGGEKDHYVKHKATVTLVLEDHNPADKNAIAVQIDDSTVGYLKRSSARAWRPVLAKQDGPVTVPAVICGAKMLGVFLEQPNE